MMVSVNNTTSPKKHTHRTYLFRLYKHRSRVGGKEVRQSYDGSVTFLVEPYPSPKDGSSRISIGSALLLAMARIQALLKIEDLIWLNRIDELKSKED